MPKPEKCITVAEARNLQNNWIASRAQQIENALGNQDTREVMWSLEELQEYLEYIKEESDKAGIKNPGVRVYFGAYDNNDNDRATVFFAPTKGPENNDENNYDIAPFNVGNSGWPPYSY
ncbi:hypothetical protein [Altibacter sp. HG106]|uniref:hypothetical protein n=1 Tax=Altibacter sp. HG106 TaxID=3023937 RepID=UPI002350DC22|nr:hypothetical protein [Altibacter sp. HG106]MDC7995422.1 hypothetical protein [Altibacter sp. HG106]